jgi:hypothetical protein
MKPKQLNLTIPDAAPRSLRTSDRPAQMSQPEPKPEPNPAPKPS